MAYILLEEDNGVGGQVEQGCGGQRAIGHGGQFLQQQILQLKHLLLDICMMGIYLLEVEDFRT